MYSQAKFQLFSGKRQKKEKSCLKQIINSILLAEHEICSKCPTLKARSLPKVFFVQHRALLHEVGFVYKHYRTFITTIIFFLEIEIFQ